MTTPDKKLWQGLVPEMRTALSQRDYAPRTLSEQLASQGVPAGQLSSLDRKTPEVEEVWIPGVEIFARAIYPQRHRGSFGEFVRRDEGMLAQIGFWPEQWASARMFASTAKGFHVHPPHVPDGTAPADWLRRCFLQEPNNFSLRSYDLEQWDVMFFVQGVAEMILRDLRAGLPHRTMR